MASSSSSSSYLSSSSSISSEESLAGPEDPDDLDSDGAALSALAMASTSTLLNEPLPLRLMFSRNSVTHATLYAAEGAMYRITATAKVSRVELVDLRIMEGREKVVATLKRRDILPNVVVFPHRQGKSLRIAKWLQQPTPPDGRTILRTLYGNFIWRSDGTLRLALYPEDQTHSPIAYYLKIEEPPTLALVLRAGFEHIRVEIITAFIVLEYRLRMGEKVKQGERRFGTTANGVVFVVGY
ncbi:hypothetical protein BJ912DRAFT_677055 [Pholiota molesta]|nr:hypothetical protein BJ912DRAFT_677055 [Pholiota molesta]